MANHGWLSMDGQPGHMLKIFQPTVSIPCNASLALLHETQTNISGEIRVVMPDFEPMVIY